MKIFLAASEAVPFCKTGGLADVVSGLALALKQKRQDARVFLPLYRAVDRRKFGLKPLGLKLMLPLGDTLESVSLWEGRLGRTVPVYFLDAPKYFDRDGLYRDAQGEDFADNDERFTLFSRAALEAAKAVDFRPDVIHCHDWQTGLVPAYLETLYKYDGFYLPTSTVFTIHNIAYQGLFPKNTLFLAGFSWADFTPDRLEYYDQMNYLKAGLVFAHALNTVSPTYAREVQDGPAFGRGMEGILKTRAADFTGILNGLDEKEWNPARDEHLAQRYAAARLEKRSANKKDLQAYAGLDVDPAAPLLGVVSRLDPQKGFDLLLACVEEFLEAGAQLAVLGQGDKEYEAALAELAASHPGRVSFSSEFDEPRAHKIYAGADVFLMPSRFEPCGLGQMIALRYGAVPVVTPTGGLLDSVAPFDRKRNAGVGFVARDVSAPALRDALAEAVALYRAEPAAWKALVKRGMSLSFAWSRSVDKYLELYKLAAARKIGR